MPLTEKELIFFFGPDQGTKLSGSFVQEGSSPSLASATLTGRLDLSAGGTIKRKSEVLTATGTVIGDSQPITGNLVRASGALNAGIQLPPFEDGDSMIIFNIGANALNLYPSSASTQVNGGGAGVPFSLTAGKAYIAQNFGGDWFMLQVN